METPVEQTVKKPNLLDLDLVGCETLVGSLGFKAFHGRNLHKWIHKHGVVDFDAMTDIPKTLRANLTTQTRIHLPRIIHDQPSADGTIKWVMELEDGQRIETVYIPDGDRSTICISSQVGCALDCAFAQPPAKDSTETSPWVRSSANFGTPPASLAPRPAMW